MGQVGGGRKGRGEAERVLEAAEWGTLGLVDADGNPYIVPLNFAYESGRIYFHGAPKGAKIDIVKTNPRATFLAVEPLALIPSFATHPERACPATQLFRSAVARGRLRLVDDPDEKAGALGALMRKLQPEGGYRPITVEDPIYTAQLRGVAVVAFEVEELSGRSELGQGWSRRKRAKAAAILRERGSERDLRTVEAILAAAPSDS